MDKLINPRLAGIAKVKSLSLDNRKIYLTCVLDGLENVDIQVVCNDLAIAEDGSFIEVGNFTSNMPFAENALNTFAAKKYPVPEDGMARKALVIVKKTLGL